MRVGQAIAFIEKTLPPGSLNKVKILVFKHAWEGKGYAAIAKETGYGVDYIKIAAAQLWKSLSQILPGKVTKNNFRVLLLTHLNQDSVNSYKLTTVDKSTLECGDKRTEKIQNYQDWGTAPDVSTFYGRNQELAQIQHCILKENCRLIALLGMGGIGKTALSVKIAQQIESEFDYIIWRTLRNAPAKEVILTEIVAFLSNQQEIKATIPKLLNLLRSHRALIVLDNFETILQPGKTGYYRPDYEDYGELLQVLGETTHQSCLLLTSREKPPEIGAFEGKKQPVRSLTLQGSPEVAQAILQAEEIQGTASQKQQLGEYYGNSPLALKIVATSIQDLFEGDLQQFLQQGTTAFNGIRRLLDKQFQRLNPLEEKIMFWLAINREWTSIAQLEQDILPGVPKFKLLESLESLCWRSLVEKQGGRYTQQPVVMEYVTDNLIEKIYQELLSTKLDTFNHYALVKTTVKDYIRTSQIKLILEPITNLLYTSFSSIPALEQHLNKILQQLRSPYISTDSHPSPLSLHNSYAPGNLINLYIYLQINLNGYDFSHLPIYNVDFTTVNLRNVNLAYADFQQSIFTQTFSVIMQVAFSPNGKLLATGDMKGNIQLWCTQDAQPRKSFPAHSGWIFALSFSPDGQILASGAEDGIIQLWDIHTGKCCGRIPIEIQRILSLAFSPNGKFLAICGSESIIYLWEIGTQQLTTLTEHVGDVSKITFDASVENLFSASYDGTLKQWDIHTGQCLETFQDHGNPISQMALSPHGEILVSGTLDGQVTLTNVSTRQSWKVSMGNQQEISSLSFHPAGQLFASNNAISSTIRFWDTQNGKCVKVLQCDDDIVTSIAFSPDGNTLVSGSSDQKIIFWDVTSGNRLRTLGGYINHIYTLTWKPNKKDGKQQLIASSGTSSSIRIWDANKGCLETTIQGHQSWIPMIAWSPDGNILASASFDRTIRLWNPDNGQCLQVLEGHGDIVYAVDWNPNGKVLATASGDLTIKLWNLHSGQSFSTLKGHEYWVCKVAWHPHGQLLASGGFDSTVRLWDTNSGECVKVFRVEQTLFCFVDWSPDANTLVFPGNEYTIQLWDISNDKRLKTLKGHTEPITWVTFNYNGNLLVSGSTDKTARIWDVETGQCLQVLTGHTAPVYPTVFSNDGLILATGGEDGLIYLWNVNSAHRYQYTLQYLVTMG